MIASFFCFVLFFPFRLNIYPYRSLNLNVNLNLNLSLSLSISGGRRDCTDTLRDRIDAKLLGVPLMN